MITPIELVRLTKDGGPLNKRMHLSPDGKLANDSSHGRMSRGDMERLRLSDWRELAPLLEETPRHVAYALGMLRPDLPDTLRLVPKADPKACRTGYAARTAETIIYQEGQAAFVLIDFDTKGMPPQVQARIGVLGGLQGTLATVCPGFAAAGYIRRMSTSANISNSLTGKPYESHGQHLHLLVRDGADARRFLYTLHDRCWLAGLGWYIVGKAGQLLERSIVDRMVYSPERLVFEANPDLEPPLRQARREAVIRDGVPLETLDTCRDLNGSEKAELARRKVGEARALGKEAEMAQKVFIKDRIAAAVAKGMDAAAARLMAEPWGKGMLRPGAILFFDDPALNEVDVADVLRDPDAFDGETLADPTEGVQYGRNCAIVQVRSDDVQIYSFAHGGAIYKIQHDVESVKATITAAPKSEAAKTLCRHAVNADLDPVELKTLINLAAERTGAGARDVQKMVAEARRAQREKAAQAVRDRNVAHSARARIDEIPPDAEIGPVMELIDDVLANITAPEPPMRDVEGWPVEVQCRETVGLHELTSEGANDEEDEKSRLSSPNNFLLTRHDRESLEILIGDYIEFVRKTGDGERSIAPVEKFVSHTMKYRRSKMPRVHAVLTMPLVLPDGTLLAQNGLDRQRRAVFRINPAMLPFIPKRKDCTPIAVDNAFRFLVDDWLGDVLTDLEGKCVLIALALSIIERILFPERPIFFVTAGIRGGGKTTALMMISLAATGIKAAAAAWSSDPAERKKAIFAYLLEALPFLIWDNIPRGTMISCPHIEAASTSDSYSDRLLGKTETPIAPAFTIQAFTGNNIGPKSDQASRSLEIHLTTDRPDPENRYFNHSDPIGWTRDHRGEILKSLYTILLGNPELDAKGLSGAPTRFKKWWHLVGSALEHAACSTAEKRGKAVLFKQMFERIEASDEEAIERADIIQALYAIFNKQKFSALAVFEHLAKSARDAADGTSEGPGAATPVLHATDSQVTLPTDYRPRPSRHCRCPRRRPGRNLCFKKWHRWAQQLSQVPGVPTRR